MDKERKKRQKELAKVFYEMGMELDLVQKISGLSKEEVIEVIDKPNQSDYNGEVKNKNDSY
jgi:allophanate hydrolase subunit 1